MLMQELVLMAAQIVPVIIFFSICVKFFCFMNGRILSNCNGNYLVLTVVNIIILVNMIILPHVYEIFFQTVLKEVILDFFV